jgi:hypothetical protein
MIEALWIAAYGAPDFPSWWSFQVIAIALGALVVLRVARSALLAYAAGVLCAAVAGAAFGCGGEWLRHAVAGGATPALEISGFGALAGLFGGFAIVVRRRVQLGPAFDALAIAIGPMTMVSRLGCFFAGCDFGAPTRSLPWALRYPHWTPAFREQLARGLIVEADAHTLPVHPTQLYEVILGAVLIFAALARRRRRSGVVLVLYAVGRFGIDFVRGDLARGALGLTVSQWLAITLVGVVVSACSAARSRSSSRKLTRDEHGATVDQGAAASGSAPMSWQLTRLRCASRTQLPRRTPESSAR